MIFKVSYRLNATLIKIPVTFYRIRKFILKFIRDYKRCQIIKDILNEKSKMSNFKIHYKAGTVRMAWQRPTDRNTGAQTGWRSGISSPVRRVIKDRGLKGQAPWLVVWGEQTSTRSSVAGPSPQDTHKSKLETDVRQQRLGQ